MKTKTTFFFTLVLTVFTFQIGKSQCESLFTTNFSLFTENCTPTGIGSYPISVSTPFSGNLIIENLYNANHDVTAQINCTNNSISISSQPFGSGTISGFGSWVSGEVSISFSIVTPVIGTTICSGSYFVPIGIQDPRNENPPIVVFMNPVNHCVNIQLNENVHSSYHISLFTISGNLIKEINLIQGDEIVIQPADLPNGVYFYVAVGDAGLDVFSGKFLIE